jgi:chorismate mutase
MSEQTARKIHEAVWNPALEIEQLRQQIDAADTILLNALAERMSLVRQIGEHKKAAAMTAVQLDRWNALLAHRLALAEKLGLSEDFVLALFERIHIEAIRLQDERAAQP